MSEYKVIIDLLEKATAESERALISMACGFLLGKVYPEDVLEPKKVILHENAMALLHLDLPEARTAALLLFMPDVAYKLIYDYGDLHRAQIGDTVKDIYVKHDAVSMSIALALALVEYFWKLSDHEGNN